LSEETQILSKNEGIYLISINKPLSQFSWDLENCQGDYPLPTDYPWTAIANFSHDICFLGKALSPKGKLLRSLIGDLEAMF
jgi:hypothetical protein